MPTYTLKPTLYTAVQFNSAADTQALLDMGCTLVNTKNGLAVQATTGLVVLTATQWVVQITNDDSTTVFRVVGNAAFQNNFVATSGTSTPQNNAMTQLRILGGSDRLARMAGSLAGSGVSGTAYWTYIGQAAQAISLGGFATLHCTTAGAGAQAAEVALASTPSAPNRSGQTLTKIVASNSITTLTSTGVKRSTAMTSGGGSVLVPAGTHLWLGFRQAMATTQAVFWSVGGDKSNGEILSTAATGPLDAGTTWSGAVVTAAVTAQAPDISFTLD